MGSLHFPVHYLRISTSWADPRGPSSQKQVSIFKNYLIGFCSWDCNFQAVSLSFFDSVAVISSVARFCNHGVRAEISGMRVLFCVSWIDKLLVEVENWVMFCSVCGKKNFDVGCLGSEVIKHLAYGKKEKRTGFCDCECLCAIANFFMGEYYCFV